MGSKHFKDALREANPITHLNANAILETFGKMKYVDWRKDVFGKKTVHQYNVRSFFFQLVATKILSFEWTHNATEVNYVITKDGNGVVTFKDVRSWNGFEFRSAAFGARKIPHANILQPYS